MINDLGEPEKLVPNPHYRKAAPAALYLIERVEAWVDAHQIELADVARKRVARSASATASADSKRAETLAWAHSVPIVVQSLPRLKRLRLEARAYYGSRSIAPGDRDRNGEPINENGIVAYVRHNYTNYEALLAQFFDRTGHDLAYQVVRQRVIAEIRARLGMPPQDEEGVVHPPLTPVA